MISVRCFFNAYKSTRITHIAYICRQLKWKYNRFTGRRTNSVTRAHFSWAAYNMTRVYRLYISIIINLDSHRGGGSRESGRAQLGTRAHKAPAGAHATGVLVMQWGRRAHPACMPGSGGVWMRHRRDVTASARRARWPSSPDRSGGKDKLDPDWDLY